MDITEVLHGCTHRRCRQVVPHGAPLCMACLHALRPLHLGFASGGEATQHRREPAVDGAVASDVAGVLAGGRRAAQGRRCGRRDGGSPIVGEACPDGRG